MSGPVCSVVMPDYNVTEVIGEALGSPWPARRWRGIGGHGRSA